jgi:hopene-associated glycosyltransferase HpnB
VTILAGLALGALGAWLYLVAAHGGFWRTDQRLPNPGAGWWPDGTGRRPGGTGRRPDGTGRRPRVAAVVPARDEAALLPETLPSLLSQDYAGDLAVVLVDDQSADGTAEIAGRLAAGAPRVLTVVRGEAPPDGWAGKVWAMAQGAGAVTPGGGAAGGPAGGPDYLWFTDADVAHGPGTLAALVGAAEADRRDLVSQMALLRAETGWERAVVPAFVYLFAQLYPFRWVNRQHGRTAAAAGGCMLVRRDALEAAGGLARIKGARIDDIALARLLKRRPGGRVWLGLASGVASRRPYPRLADLWSMIARSAYTQLRYSPALLAGTVAGLLVVYAVPPAATIAALVALALGGGAAAGWTAAAGLASWTLMSASYLPMLRLYRLSPLRAPTLAPIALLYAAMTVDSARRHHLGRGAIWKGRAAPLSGGPPRGRRVPRVDVSRATNRR